MDLTATQSMDQCEEDKGMTFGGFASEVNRQEIDLNDEESPTLCTKEAVDKGGFETAFEVVLCGHQ
jgi:hypothetical protein